MAASTSNFIFLGVNVASCKNDRELKSLLMREHYRKKREIAAPSLGSGINQTSSQRSQRLKHVPFARFPKNAIKQYRKLAPSSATRRLLPSTTASSTHGPTPNKPRSDSPPFHEPQKSPSLAGNRVADVLLPSSDRHIRRQLHEALWHCATITRPVFVDPVFDMTASLAVESRRHFRHYFLMPNAWLNLPPDSLTCKTYNIPLAMRFPILVHGFAAFSSGNGGTSATDKAVSVRHHSELVKRVNEEMAKPYPDYDTALLGIQGVMASAFVRGDENEFAIHRRGQASFFRSCGIPQDPDVMLHVVSNSLMYGSPIVDCLINDPGAAGSDIEVTNLLRTSVDLEKMVLSIFDQPTSFKTVTAPERAVLGHSA
ncbi:Cleavage and polyadenylation factor complex subunit [Elsinoe australis]|uniref:Cleavage and polyadenylation factor complex subunit n=1 Tax=Elsinoe australis TaxID=40998 RepID=A0A2P7YVM6_9PEZI|nr:Cleavage and polyadenylation factor complex subunit [Elsinoe australis]